MKKSLLKMVALMAVICFASCDSKLCYCYESTAQGVYESEVYTNTDSPCSALSTSNRGCVEQNERMDPGQIAYK